MLPDDKTVLRARLLAAVCEYIVVGSGRLPSFPLHLTIQDGHNDRLLVDFSRQELSLLNLVNTQPSHVGNGASPATPQPPPADVPLRRVHRKILEKAGTVPMPTKQLVRLAGYSVNAWSRDAVTFLCRQGLLVQTPDGVCRPA